VATFNCLVTDASSGAVTFICVYEIKIKPAARVDLENIQILSSNATKLLVESLINTRKNAVWLLKRCPSVCFCSELT